MASDSNKTRLRASDVNSIATSRRLTKKQPLAISRPIVVRILCLHHVSANRRVQEHIRARIFMTVNNMFHEALNFSRFDNILSRQLVCTNLVPDKFNEHSGRVYTVHARLLVRLLQRNSTGRHRTRRYNHTSREHRCHRRHTQAATRRNTRRRPGRRTNIDRQFPPSRLYERARQP